jgi:hypothetical protein
MTWRPITSDPDSIPDTEGWYLLRGSHSLFLDGPEYMAAHMIMNDGQPWFCDANENEIDIHEWDDFTRIEDNDNG